MNAIISADGDGIGAKIGQLRLADDVEGLRRQSQAIERGNELLRTFAVNCGGSVVESGGDEICFEIPADKLGELPAVREQYETATEATLSMGVGMKVSESSKALLAAKLLGKDRIVFFSPTVEQILGQLQRKNPDEAEKLSAEYFGKAEGSGGSPSSHPGMIAPGKQLEDSPVPPPEIQATHAARDFEREFHGAAQQQSAQEDAQAKAAGGLEAVKAKVVQVLQQVKAQAPVLEQIAQQAPDVYRSILDMTNAVVQMARQLPRASTDIQKSEKPEVKTTTVTEPHPHEFVPITDEPTPEGTEYCHRCGKMVFKTEVDGNHPKCYKGFDELVEKAGVNFAKTMAMFQKGEYPRNIDDAGAERLIARLHTLMRAPRPVPWDTRFRLQDVPVDRLPARIKPQDTFAQKYAAMRTKFPPILMLGDDDILDGHHRVAAARIRGDKTIRAYVPVKKTAKIETEPSESPPAPGVLDKAGLPMPHAPKRIEHTLPVGSQVGNKVKVQHADGSVSYKQMGAGQILSQDPSGHATSSREPGAR